MEHTERIDDDGLVNERLAEAQDDEFLAILIADAAVSAQSAHLLAPDALCTPDDRLPTAWEALLATTLAVSPSALARWCDAVSSSTR